MENKPSNLEELFQKSKEYADVRVELFKLKAIKKLSGFLSSFFSIFILVIIFATIMLCITIGASLLIGAWLGKAYYGFFIVGGISFIIGLIIYSMRDKIIKTKVSNKLIKEILD